MFAPGDMSGRVTPRLTDYLVRGGRYLEPLESELSRSNLNKIADVCSPGTRVPGYPLFVLYGPPKTGVYIDIYMHCGSRLSPLKTTKTFIVLDDYQDMHSSCFPLLFFSPGEVDSGAVVW